MQKVVGSKALLQPSAAFAFELLFKAVNFHLHILFVALQQAAVQLRKQLFALHWVVHAHKHLALFFREAQLRWPHLVQHPLHQLLGDLAERLAKLLLQRVPEEGVVLHLPQLLGLGPALRQLVVVAPPLLRPHLTRSEIRLEPREKVLAPAGVVRSQSLSQDAVAPRAQLRAERGHRGTEFAEILETVLGGHRRLPGVKVVGVQRLGRASAAGAERARRRRLAPPHLPQRLGVHVPRAQPLCFRDLRPPPRRRRLALRRQRLDRRVGDGAVPLSRRGGGATSGVLLVRLQLGNLLLQLGARAEGEAEVPLQTLGRHTKQQAPVHALVSKLGLVLGHANRFQPLANI
mmetsp:Transcript_43441/g.82875  ORF Transcript_43441/g.82875 Transcript_43441/m.82875 type:complete len:346 (+) Transcript_43441:1284-2321(+)